MIEYKEWPRTVATFESLEEWESLPEIPNGRTVIFENSIPIHYSVDMKVGAPLVVVLQGAKTPSIQLPYLGGTNLTADFRVSKLFISDPSLYLSNQLNLAWYAGNERQVEFQHFLVRLVKKIQQQGAATRVVLVGGSGGGFASLVASYHIPGSTALVWNPQTDIEKYNEDHVRQYFEICWGGKREVAKSNIITSVVDLYGSCKPENRVLYLQSATDEWHMRDHMAPFIETLKGTGVVETYIANWGEGHIPPPKETIISALAGELEEWSLVKTNLEFVAI